ncbi:hypothetical protein JYK21_12445 [Ralstonia pickettii]|nr:hypothetical protein [Ralstonia pickettii]
MAQCVLVADGGAMTVTNDAPQACQGYLMLTPGEFQNATTFYTWMQVPSQTDMATVFVTAFGLVAASYLVGYAIGRLVAMFND